MPTKIEWTNETWNPIIGCSKISEGCQNCYAEKFAYRLANMEMANNEHIYHYTHIIDWQTKRWNDITHLIKSALEKPFKWKKPRMIFVCSMGDLFHESVPCEWIDKVFEVMFECEQHIFQILTKRPENLLKYIKAYEDWQPELVENIWFGVTAENQEMANKRIPILLQIPAKVRFVSCEPLLSNINFHPFICRYGDLKRPEQKYSNVCEPSNNIDWIITGRETGSKARPMEKEWIESLYWQCKDAEIPFFDKRNELGLNIQEYPKWNGHI